MTDAKKELEEATEAVEELIDDNKTPFGRWLIKLIVEKLLAPVLTAAITAALTAILGWYAIGQKQVQLEAQKVGIEAGAKAAEAEAEKLEEARALIADWEERETSSQPSLPVAPKPLELEAALEKMRGEWKSRHERSVPLTGLKGDPDTSNAINLMQQQIQEQRERFPEEYIRARLQEQQQYQDED